MTTQTRDTTTDIQHYTPRQQRTITRNYYLPPLRLRTKTPFNLALSSSFYLWYFEQYLACGSLLG